MPKRLFSSKLQRPLRGFEVAKDKVSLLLYNRILKPYPNVKPIYDWKNVLPEKVKIQITAKTSTVYTSIIIL